MLQSVGKRSSTKEVSDRSGPMKNKEAKMAYTLLLMMVTHP
jgi:hypothetical protein